MNSQFPPRASRGPSFWFMKVYCRSLSFSVDEFWPVGRLVDFSWKNGSWGLAGGGILEPLFGGRTLCLQR